MAGGALVSGTAGTTAGQSGESWAQFGYDAANTGHAPDNTGPVAGIERQWRFETGGVVPSPAIANGTVYVGSQDNNVYAIDAADGTEQWRFETENSVFSSPAIQNGTVYVGGADSNVYALDAANGTEQWRFETGGGVVSSPAIVNDTVYLGSNDNNVYALDAADGTEQWRFETGGEVYRATAILNGTVYVGSEDTNVYALDAADGTEQWRFETGGEAQSPAVVNGTVYVGSEDNNVYALNAADGAEQWRFETGGVVDSSPAIANGTIYVGSTDDNAYAIDAADGTEQWRFEAGSYVQSPPAIANDTVYVGSNDSNVYALNAADGTERWRYETGGQVYRSPAVANGTVYVGSVDNNLHAITDDTPTPTPTPTPTRTPTAIPQSSGGSTGGDGGGAAGETGGDDGGSSMLPVAGGLGALGAGGGLWYWRRKNGSDTDRRPDEGARTTDARDGGTGSGSSSGSGSGAGAWVDPSETGTPGGGAASTSGADDPSSEIGTHADALETGDDRREEAATLADRGDHREALAALDDAEAAYRDALDAAESSDGLDADRAEERLASLDDDRREVRRDRLTDRFDALRTDLDRVAGRLDSDPERARERLSDLESRVASLGDEAGEMGFDDLQEEVSRLESERVDLLADAEAALAGGPPARIPRAPDVSVDYDALTDEEPIGAGGNADVVRATFPGPTGDVTLAVKRPRMQGTLHTDAVERMLDEAETWDKLDDHDHVVGVVDYGAQPVPWIAMEYMDAGDLSERAGDLPFDQALWTAIAVTKGVRHAHRRGVAHLDLKPANVLFRSVDGAWDVPKVADWGLSKHLLNHSKSVEGLSPQYAAPEQFDTDRGAADDLTDVYQLGAVLYELFTGRPPFDGAAPAAAMHRVLNEEPTPPSEVADVPEALDDVLLTALAKERADRFESVLLLRNELRELGD